MENKLKLLVVDDDSEIRDLVGRFLSEHHYHVDTAHDAQQMDNLLKRTTYDLVILDVMLPGEDGLSICRRLRHDLDMPIIMLTAAGTETDRIVGLELGADDYLPKPFNPRELLARIKAVLRRSGDNNAPKQAERHTYIFETFSLDSSKRQLNNENGELIALTSGEYDLLLVFLHNPQRVLDRDQLLSKTKGREANPFDRSIDVQLSRLRKKIELDPKDPQIIKTVRAGGYIFTATVDVA